MDNVRAAVRYLVDQFPVVNRRAGRARENPTLGHPPASAPVVSDETAQRIARALEAFVALYARVHSQENPLARDDSSDGDQS